MADTAPHGQVASDTYFTCIDGDDFAPDIAIGRISARSPDDVAAAVARIKRYAAGEGVGDWQKRALVVADNDDALFEADCERVAGLLTAAGLQVTKLYLREQPSPADMTAALLKELAAGNLFAVYVGHAEVRSWASEQVLTDSAVRGIQWSDAFTFITTFTCLDGAFETGTDPCLAELFMQPPLGGAVACFSPTGLGYPDQHDILAQALIGKLLAGDVTIGEAAVQAEREALAQRADMATLVRMYVLFGDPALRLRTGSK